VEIIFNHGKKLQMRSPVATRIRSAEAVCPRQLLRKFQTLTEKASRRRIKTLSGPRPHLPQLTAAESAN